MGRLNFILLVLVMVCALKVVDYQHKSRSLFVSLGLEQQAERDIEIDFTRLQLEQAALAKGERVDAVARAQLKMAPPDPGTVVFLPVEFDVRPAGAPGVKTGGVGGSGVYE